MKKIPTIKGIFVMSHVRALAREKGEDAVLKLVKRMGKRVRYKNTEDVPVREEVAIIEHVLDLLSSKAIPHGRREFEAGKLHFKNFSETPLGAMVLNMFSLKMALMRVPWIAKKVFRGVLFTSKAMGTKSVRVTMENNDYNIEHFRGFFHAWVEYAGYRGQVEAVDLGGDTYTYTVSWK